MWCKPVESLELGCFTPAKDMPKEGGITAQFLKSQVIYSLVLLSLSSYSFPLLSLLVSNLSDCPELLVRPGELTTVKRAMIL